MLKTIKIFHISVNRLKQCEGIIYKLCSSKCKTCAVNKSDGWRLHTKKTP